MCSEPRTASTLVFYTHALTHSYTHSLMGVRTHSLKHHHTTTVDEMPVLLLTIDY